MDLYRYDEAWELQPKEALSHFADDTTLKPNTILIDLRTPLDFVACQIPGAYNLPLQSVKSSSPSPFSEAAVLESQWRDLEAMFTSDRINAYDLSGKTVCMICYNGDTARVATSVLRAKGIVAVSIRGGYAALKSVYSELQRGQEGRGAVQEWSKTRAVLVNELRTDLSSSQGFGQNGVPVEVL